MPEDIMSGYSVIMEEVVQQLKSEQNGETFTHVILQVGVGSFAASMARFIREQFDQTICIVTIEPRGSDCLYQSMIKDEQTSVSNCPQTVMVGLDCGVLSDIAWPTLRRSINAAARIDDKLSGNGIKFLH